MAVKYPIPIPDGSAFSLGNIPFGIFSLKGGPVTDRKPRAGTAIGAYVLDLDVLTQHGIFQDIGCADSSDNIFAQPTLNAFAACPADQRRRVRALIIQAVGDADSAIFTRVDLNVKAFVPMENVEMHLPMRITDYSDSFGSLIHAENSLGPFGLKMPPAWFQFPMAYNGRTGGVAQSGTDVVRPMGFFPDVSTGEVAYQTCRELDFEIGLGMLIAEPLAKGREVKARDAGDHIFGFVLHNDWSARDVQKFEMAPLGVFLSKSFLTSISPWVVTLEALQGCVSGPPPSNATKTHPMFVCDEQNSGLFDIELSAKVSRNGLPEVEVTRVNHKDSYWSTFQMFAYHSLSGCGLNTGDLISTGTISSPAPQRGPDEKQGPRRGTFGCLTEPRLLKETLPDVDGKPMEYLQDGDRLTFEGWFKTVDGGIAGFGPLTSLVLPRISE